MGDPQRIAVPGLAPLDAARIPWRETRIAGVAWLPLHLESEHGPRAGGGEGSTVLIRMDPGCGYPRHAHLDVEEVLCLAGGYEDELGTVRAGDYVRYGKGSAHAPVALPGEPCVLFAVARGGIRLADEPDGTG
jgi:anti-sigma factor ChrR (cupin superfamily)